MIEFKIVRDEEKSSSTIILNGKRVYYMDYDSYGSSAMNSMEKFIKDIAKILNGSFTEEYIYDEEKWIS